MSPKGEGGTSPTRAEGEGEHPDTLSVSEIFDSLRYFLTLGALPPTSLFSCCNPLNFIIWGIFGFSSHVRVTVLT